MILTMTGGSSCRLSPAHRLVDSPPAGRLHILTNMTRKAQPPPRSFEEALQELEQILSDIEGGQVGLEESLVRYERGTFLIQHCRGVLSRAEKQIEILNKAADGSITSTPMEGEPNQEVPET